MAGLITRRIVAWAFPSANDNSGFEGPHELQRHPLGTLGHMANDVIAAKFIYALTRDGVYDWVMIDDEAARRIAKAVPLTKPAG